MELSELTLYDNRLLSFDDDRTGTVYEILNKKSGKESFAVPRFVVTEGSGDTDKGMKWEWATVKNRELYMGSMGKEYTNPDGSIANTNNLWISIISPRGELRRDGFVRKVQLCGEGSSGCISARMHASIEAPLWSYPT
jgi:soluble calcium-activated nucleotidase 1